MSDQHYFFNKAAAADMGKSKIIERLGKHKNFQLVLHGEGLVGAMVDIAFSNNKEDWFEIDRTTFDGENFTQRQVKNEDVWFYTRVTFVDIVGTDARLTVVAATE